MELQLNSMYTHRRPNSCSEIHRDTHAQGMQIWFLFMTLSSLKNKPENHSYSSDEYSQAYPEVCFIHGWYSTINLVLCLCSFSSVCQGENITKENHLVFLLIYYQANSLFNRREFVCVTSQKICELACVPATDFTVTCWPRLFLLIRIKGPYQFLEKSEERSPHQYSVLALSYSW